MRKRNNFRVKFSVIILAMLTVIIASIPVFAASSPTSVTIYANNTSKKSKSIYCSGLIEGYGVNSSSSTRALYYTVRFEKKVGSTEAYSSYMAPGTGKMGSSSVSEWKKVMSSRTVPNGPGNYFVKLNPSGALKSGCYGAGKLVD